MWAALLALTVPLPLIWLTKWPVEHIYLVQLAVFAVGLAPHPMGAASPGARAEGREARPRP